ncbi:hypothetical protein BDZ45DRAFT_339061 [Acephala macrosclerotiorum]|nr:hypothetical protein BDZ45DRAFT_339061 [Acephala macrosclerotiorum]
MIFVMCSYTTNQDDNSGPAQSQYYSTADGSVCYLYFYKDTGKYKGNLDKPKGLDDLNGTAFGIWGSNITEASVRAYQIAKFNYSQDIANNRIIESVSSNGNLTPFTDGPTWEGTWTIPVCHTGNHNWNTQDGDITISYGSLPCCCGPNCNETATFVQAANMTGFQTLLHGCQSQLAGTDIDFSTVDYGFKENNGGGVHLGPLGLGPIIGIAIAGGAVVTSIILCFCCCC